MKLHLVVPCYRESSRIGKFLPGLCEEMQRVGNVEIQVVEDGSGDEEQIKMRQIVADLSLQFSCLSQPLMLKDNLGKGGAIYAGWSNVRNAGWLGFVDADGACPAVEVARLVKLARSSEFHGVALFASRVKMLGYTVERLFKRHLLGRVYATLVSEVLDIPVYDSQCGLKLVPRAAYEKVATSLQVMGFAFDVELLVALRDSGCEVREVPINWREIPGGKVRLLHDSFSMALDVLKIRSRRQRAKN